MSAREPMGCEATRRDQQRQITAAMADGLMCRKHWLMMPAHLREDIWLFVNESALVVGGYRAVGSCR